MKKDEQANVLLSLKNLYRLFTVKDYPVYSTGILSSLLVEKHQTRKNDFSKGWKPEPLSFGIL